MRTAARREGDAWYVSGQKIWTSYASMAQWCFLLARTSREERKQQGLTIFLVPMSQAGIEVRPIASMMGPHHLNEVFFDDVRVTEADVLGAVGGGWAVVQEVLAFERVGIARYARCERLLHAAPEALGEGWDGLPSQLRERWMRMLVQARRARLLAYRVVSLQAAGRVRPAGRGRLPDRRDAPRSGQCRRAHRDRRLRARIAGGRAISRRNGRPCRLFGRCHDLVRKQRHAADPALACAAGEPMNIELGAEATAFGAAARQAFANAGGDDLVQAAERDPACRASRIEPVLASLGAWELQPRDSADELEAAAALCRSAGWWALPYPIAERLSRPADLAVDGLLVAGDGRDAAAVHGLDLRWAATDLSGRRHRGRPEGRLGNAA